MHLPLTLHSTLHGIYSRIYRPFQHQVDGTADIPADIWKVQKQPHIKKAWVIPEYIPAQANVCASRRAVPVQVLLSPVAVLYRPRIWPHKNFWSRVSVLHIVQVAFKHFGLMPAITHKPEGTAQGLPSYSFRILDGSLSQRYFKEFTRPKQRSISANYQGRIPRSCTPFLTEGAVGTLRASAFCDSE